MSDWNEKLIKLLQEANTATDRGDFSVARTKLITAAECVLEMAKAASGKKREAHYDKYKSLIEIANNLGIVQGEKPSERAVLPSKSPEVKGEAKHAPTARPNVERAASTDVNPLKLQRLEDYIGQPKAVAAVTDLITAARLKGTALPHLMMFGSHGLGKTTFARIMANEMGTNFIELNAAKMSPKELTAILKNLKPKDIVFIDEIHTIPQVLAETVLYSAMQDGKITFLEGKGKFVRSETVQLVPFTLIGATTEIGKLPKPFVQRAIQIRLEEYSDEIISSIIHKAFVKLGMSISEDNALHIAFRARNNPRIALSFAKRIADKALVWAAKNQNIKSDGSFSSQNIIRKLNISIEKELIDKFFDENAIDSKGLEEGDRALLSLIIEKYHGGPVSLDTLAKAMNESNNVITDKYEAYLIKKGFIKIERDGRVVLPAGYKHMNVDPKKGRSYEKQGGESQTSAAVTPDNVKKNRRKPNTTYRIADWKTGSPTPRKYSTMRKKPSSNG